MKQILCILAHPRLKHSQVHKALINPLKDQPQVMVQDLYELYPDFFINIKKEQLLLRQADVIIWQFPLYWYAPPAILKEWFDTVLIPGFAFGAGGTELRGKYLWPVVTCGAGSGVDNLEGNKKHAIENYLLPLFQTARDCGLTVFDPFVVDHAQDMTEEQLQQCVNEYSTHVEALIYGKLLHPQKTEP